MSVRINATDLGHTPHDDSLEHPGPDAIEISDEILSQKYILIRALDPRIHGVFGLLSFAIPKTESLKKYEAPEDDEMGRIGDPRPSVVIIKKIAPKFVACTQDRRRTLRLEINAMNMVKELRQRYDSGGNPHKQHLPSIFFADIKEACWVGPEKKAEQDKGMWFASSYIPGPTISAFIAACRDTIPKADQTEKTLATAVPRWVIPLILYQVIQGVAWLHKPSRGKPWMVAHRDLHIGNIMIDLGKSLPKGLKHPCNLWGLSTPIPKVTIIDLGCPYIRYIDTGRYDRHPEFDSREWVLHESFNSGHKDPMERLEVFDKDCLNIGYLVIALVFSCNASKEIKKLISVMNHHLTAEGSLSEGMKEALDNMGVGSRYWGDILFQLMKQSHLDNALAVVAKWIEDEINGNVTEKDVEAFREIVEAGMPEGPSGDDIDEAIEAWQIELMKEENERLLSGGMEF